MQPSNPQLLKQLRNAIAQLSAGTSGLEHQALLRNMDVVLNELQLRCDRGFYLDFYRRGRALLAEGLAPTGHAADILRTQLAMLPSTLDPDFDIDVIGYWTAQLLGALTQLIETIAPTSSSWARRVTEWELTLYTHRLKRIALTNDHSANQSLAIEKAALEQYLRNRKPEWQDLELTQFLRVAGGFSKCTILFETSDALNGKQSFALRAEQPIHLLDLDGSNIANEFPVVKKAFESGIPVAEPLWLETDRSLLATRFFVSRKASGANFGTAIGGEGRLSLAAIEELAHTMAAIHNIPLNRDDAWINECHFGKWLDFGLVRQNTLAHVWEWRRQAEAANVFPSPATTRAFDWLIANVPEYDGEVVFAHCDFGPHNILLDGDRVTAVLDWEISTPADPALDVAWFLNCSGAAADRQRFLTAYRRWGGKPMSEYRIRYFDVFMSMALPITCNAALRLIEDNDAANLDLAFYGLQFMHEYQSRLEGAIAMAESVRHLQ